MNMRQVDSFYCLRGNDVITAEVSDHHPVLHHGTLFWNIMMQCDFRKGSAGYNNGFGIIEDNAQYMKRLKKIATVIAECIYRNPTIEVITLCEGPIKESHVKHFYQLLTSFSWMKRFFKMKDFYKVNQRHFQNWGLLMLCDKQYEVTPIDFLSDAGIKIKNRFQMWRLNSRAEERFIFQAHLPFSGNETKEDSLSLSTEGKVYANIIQSILTKNELKNCIICADFNFNPFLILKDAALNQIPSHNSILFVTPDCKKSVTVDGILLSTLEKQKLSLQFPLPRLFKQLKREHHLFQDYVNHANEKSYFINQKEYDKKFGLVVRSI